MIWTLVYFGLTVWLTWYASRTLYIAATRGYVMALTRPFVGTVETPQTRKGNPQKFWANVIVWLLLFPVALSGLYFSSMDLFVALGRP